MRTILILMMLVWTMPQASACSWFELYAYGAAAASAGLS